MIQDVILDAKNKKKGVFWSFLSTFFELYIEFDNIKEIHFLNLTN
ncbi:UDP-GlcNAc:betaGal beta-1 3-N-acetylglucosaminyltransferase 7 [Bienertia sinuspersici]